MLFWEVARMGDLSKWSPEEAKTGAAGRDGVPEARGENEGV